MSFGGSSGASPSAGVATFRGSGNSAGPAVASFTNDGGRVSAFEFSHNEIEAAIQRMRFGIMKANASKTPLKAPTATVATPESEPPQP